MELTDLTIEVRDVNLNRVGVILPTDATFELRDEFCNVGKWSITLPLEHPMVAKLRTPGAGLIATGPDSNTLLSGPVVASSSTGSADAPEGMVTIDGVTDDVVLSDALAYANPASSTMAGQTVQANDVRTGPLETVMHAFVNANIGPGAPAARRKARLVMGTNLGRGPSVTKSARFPVLGNLLNEIAALGDIGFRVIQRGQQLVFETYQVADRTKTIRMDLWNNTLASYDVQTAGATLTRAIVAGQEEGVKRQLLERTTAEAQAQEALWGRRIERFLDQRQTDDITELQQAGDKVLAKEGIAQAVIKFVPMDDTTMRPLYDWWLGDKVTAVIEGQELTALVQAAIIRVDSDGLRVAVALGDQKGTVGQIQAFQNAIEQRVSAIERTVEVSSNTPEVIPSGTDLNGYLEDGVWDIDSVALANSTLNLPAPPIPASGADVGVVRPASFGTLRVHNTGTRIVQEFTALLAIGGTARSFTYRRVRGAGGTTWGPWVLDHPAIPVRGEVEQELVAKSLNAHKDSPVGIRRLDQRHPMSFVTLNGDTWYSESGLYVASPNWRYPTFATNWIDYSNGFLAAQYRRLSSGVVMLRGLIRSVAANLSSDVIFVLPPGYRPAHKLMFLVGADTVNGTRIDVLPNGEVRLPGATGTSRGYVSLAGIQFPAADVAPDSAWTPLTFQNGFSSYHTTDPSWPVAGYWVDPYGRVWFRGLFGRAAALTADTIYAQLPAALATNQQVHYAAEAWGGFSSQHALNAGLYVKTGTTGMAWISTPQFPIMPKASYPESAWATFAFVNSWQNYGTGSFPAMSLTEAPDGLMHLRGLINAGAVGQNIAGVGASYGSTPLGTLIYAGAANNAYARTDISSGAINSNSGSNAWWSLDNIVYLREA